MGRGLSELQKTILINAVETYPERIKETMEVLQANGRLSEGFIPDWLGNYYVYGTEIHKRFYGCYDESDWREPTPAQRVSVSKAFKRLGERGLVAKTYSGFKLTEQGLEQGLSLLGNTCP